MTDDVASGAPAEAGSGAGRRGLFVFKAAAAAAHRGDDLDAVEAAARHANARTRTYGAAFAGCTLPARKSPCSPSPRAPWNWGSASTASPEPRPCPPSPRSTSPTPSWTACSPNSPRVTGSACSSTAWAAPPRGPVHLLLPRPRPTGAGRSRPHRPQVGEFITSLDMAGVSLSVIALDDELTALLDAPATPPDSPCPPNRRARTTPA
ncbi:dihydroxyacetone kinase subunit DhaK [Streptomyces sp. M19]